MKTYRKIAAGLLLLSAALPTIASAHPPIAAEQAAANFEQAQRGWCRDPGLMSAPARAFFEPLWRDLAERAAPTMGGGDPGREPGMLRLLTLPADGLLPGLAGGGADLVLTVAGAEFAVGDVSRVRAGRRVPETMRD